MTRPCENCGAPVDGDYCTACGQRTASIDLPIGEFAREIAGETLGLDSRVRRTLRPLFLEPGAVARDYVAGRRARFVPPVRLYLFASFVMFLVLTLSANPQFRNFTINGEPVVSGAGDDPNRADTAQIAAGNTPPVDSAGDEESEAGSGDSFGDRIEDALRDGIIRAQADATAFAALFINRLAQAMFVLLPVFALLLKIAYRRRLYVHHLVFSIYHHCFVFLLAATTELPSLVLDPVVADRAGLVLLVVPVHLLVGMRTFYGGGWASTVLKWALVSFAYTVVSAAVLIVLLVMTLITI